MIFKAVWLSIDSPKQEDASQHGHVAIQRPSLNTSLKSNFRILELL